MANNIDRVAFWQDIRRGVLPVAVASSFATILWIFGANTPVSQEKISGTVIRNSFSADYNTSTPVRVWIELEGGRIITVSTAIGPQLAQSGEHVIIIRYVKRFFGDSFGLAN